MVILPARQSTGHGGGCASLIPKVKSSASEFVTTVPVVYECHDVHDCKLAKSATVSNLPHPSLATLPARQACFREISWTYK